MPAGQAPALAAIAAGGALGALARHGIGLLLPTAPGAFPAATFGINVLGCLLIGVLLVVVTEVRAAHPLVRPFLATGVLGGFTTFSTYALDARQLLGTGHAVTALGYVAGTLVAAVLATWAGAAVTRRVVR